MSLKPHLHFSSPLFFLFIFFSLSYCGTVLNIYCGWITKLFLNVEILFLVANAPFIMHNIVVFFIVTESLQLKSQKASEVIQAYSCRWRIILCRTLDHYQLAKGPSDGVSLGGYSSGILPNYRSRFLENSFHLHLA